MILYHASEKENLILKERPMFFGLSWGVAKDFGDMMLVEDFYIHKYFSNIEFKDLYNSVNLNNHNSSWADAINLYRASPKSNKGYAIINAYMYKGHLESEGGNMQICLYNPIESLTFLDKEKIKQ